VASLCRLIVDSPVWLLLALLVASASVIGFSDWLHDSEAARTAMSIRELEALFALEDTRKPQPRS
jgi:hypothetical protein